MEIELKTPKAIIPTPQESSAISNPSNDFTVEGSELLNLPDKALPIIDPIHFNRLNYFLIEGGRASGKTQSVARFLLYLAEQKSIRIVCGREIQKSVEESVYAVLVDLINKYNLNYEILSTKITHRATKSTFHFRGFREQGSTNIKGLEGVSILWVDEAQAITKQTLDVIIPTIRKEKSKVYWTMNRMTENDPVFSYFANRDDCMHIHINYNENKHCPQKAITEAEICKQRDLADYEYIWLGHPRAKSADYLFGMDMIRDSIGLDMNRIGVSKCIIGNDVARFGDCETVFSVLKSHGPIQWEQHYQEAKKYTSGRPGEDIVGRVLNMQKEFEADAIVMDADGAGGYLTDFMPQTKEFELFSFKSLEGWKDDPEYEKFGDRRTAAYFKVAEWMNKGWLKILADQTLIDQLLTIRYHYDRHSRTILFSKDEMRADLVSSPDRADALAYAVYFADQVMAMRPGERAEYANMNSDVDMVGRVRQAVMD